MRHAFYLALRYIGFHKLKTIILVACITLTLYLPAAMHALVDRFQAELRSRAATTPLVIGAVGSRFDLALHALYFEAAVPSTIAWRETAAVHATGLAQPIPLLIRHRARGLPIVGTSLDYFSFRELRVADGAMLARLGDCVLGARAARRLGLEPGDSLLSDPENVFDIGGSYPLKMRVVGVLAPAYSPDDDAVFVDVKTAWVIQGLGHGHQDLAQATDPNVVLKREADRVVASAALMQFIEITDENLATFHFHGEMSDFPLTSLIAVPPDVKSATLLIGRYQRSDATAQILVPDEVVQELLQMVFRIQRLFDLGAVVLAVITTLFVVLVILLSLRLRSGEMQTLFRLGCSRFTLFRLLAAELILVLGSSFLLAAVLAFATQQLAPQLLRQWLF